MKWRPLTCSDASVVLDVPDTEADDTDTTSWLYDLFTRTVGA